MDAVKVETIDQLMGRLEAVREATAREREGEIGTEEMLDLIAGAIDFGQPWPVDGGSFWFPSDQAVALGIKRKGGKPWTL